METDQALPAHEPILTRREERLDSTISEVISTPSSPSPPAKYTTTVSPQNHSLMFAQYLKPLLTFYIH
jgi:hypothetical protein